MNYRICKQTRKWTTILCAMSLLSALNGCSDSYDLDDKNPDWLGTNIYDALETKGNYKNFVKLIDDLDYKNVLSKTGSKTLFVADDDAFEEFYSNNSWGVRSYEDLTKAQKKILLNSAMINNAYLLEMMSSTEGPVLGQCLRRETSADVTDSVPHLMSKDLPTSYNTEDKDYWERFRDEEKGGIYIALDNSKPMMTHFLPAQMSWNKITNNDFKIITGQEREQNDAHIYDCKVIEQDITCQNGYINRLDKVLITPPNMAEVLRTNGMTNIFSHMIDRFSAPFYDDALTRRYQLLYGNSVDSVFQKRYFSKFSHGTELNNDRGTNPVSNPAGNQVAHMLNFDPGWNEYYSDNQTEKEADMGVIFAPTDEKLYEYFFGENGGGKFLIDSYAADLVSNIEGNTDYENIYRAIDQIPLAVIEALLNNLMKVSFNNCVPSKFETIKDDAQDPMLDETHIPLIKDVKLANNGIIYIMDEVLTPAKYAAVSAPAYVGTDMRIFNYAINQTRLDMQTNYYAYLLAMSARFSFFVPKDEGFWYIDPASFALTKGGPRALYFTWDEKKKQPICTPYSYTYNYVTGEGVIGERISTQNVSEQEWKNRLRDLLETHTIVHKDETELNGIDETEVGVESDKHYFITKNYSPIYVKNAKQRENGCTVKGGWQMAHNEECEVTRFDDKTRQTNGNGNGYAYQIDKPLMPTIESVFSVMYNDRDNFGEFFDLCQTDAEVLKECGYSATEQKKFYVFIDNNGLPAFDKTTGNKVSSPTNVKFFNNFHYTVYIPTNNAVRDAISRGLPTWEQMRKMLYLDNPEEQPEWTQEETQEVHNKVRAMATLLINFIKNHFQDNAVFADTPALKPTKYETATLQLDEDGMPTIYSKVEVSSRGNGSLTIKDGAGHVRNITDKKNILTRDYILNNTSQPVIQASSTAIVHGIDGVLDYIQFKNDNYKNVYENAAARKQFMIKNKLIDYEKKHN